MANNTCWVNIQMQRPRGFMAAYGLAMPIDPAVSAGLHNGVPVFTIEGISVPISRGSPPILDNR